MSGSIRQSPCYCINFRRAANLVTHIYDKILLPTGLTVNQYSLLVNMSKMSHCSVSELADAVGLERTTLVRMLKPLFDIGLVEDAAAAGRRNRQMMVTEKGMLVLKEGQPLWEKAQREIEQKLGAANISAISDVLLLLLK